MRYRFSLICISLCLSSSAWAWGYLGHRVIAQLTWPQLTPSTQQSMHRILKDQSFDDASTWADRIRPSHAKWHYTTMIKPSGVPQGPGRLYDALQWCYQTLQHPKQPVAHLSEADALRYMIHLVAEAHQPLHCGQIKDRGGTRFWVRWQKKRVSLHQLWDTIVVEDWIHHRMSPSKQSYVTNTQDFLTWLKQSRKLHRLIYPKQKHCTRQKPCRLPNHYLEDHRMLVNHQLYLASYRLAWLLNGLYDKGTKQSR